MIRLTLRRLIAAVPLVFGVVSIIFVMVRLLPGDPTSVFISPEVPPAVAEQLRTQFGLDKSIWEQYVYWILGVSRGEFGFSFTHQQDVFQVIRSAFSNTALLAVAAIFFQVAVGISLGLLAVTFRNTFVDRFISLGGLIVYTLPTFWIAIMLLYIFSYSLGIFPSAQMHSVGAEDLTRIEYLLDKLRHLILPATVLGIPGAAATARYLRSNLIEVLNEDYITAARSLGLSERKIFLFYALPNALIPTITLTGMTLGLLLTGAIVTETIFSWPGMGRLTVTAIFARDYPLIIGCTMVAGFAIIFGNLFADLIYRFADPRIRSERI